MLARKAEGLEAGLADVARLDGDGAGEPNGADGDGPAWRGRVLAETKYDGIRAQAHVDGDDVRLFTRRLVDVTEGFPEVVDALRTGVTAERALLDGELVGYDAATGEPAAFQELSRRVKREDDVDELAAELPATLHPFDCLHVDGRTLLDEPLRDRLDALETAFDPVEGLTRATATVPDDVAAARARYREAVDAGHEGVMLKNLDAGYQPGRRVGRMLKHKPVMEPLDLVVTRGQYSEGRRSSLLGRLYLGAYDPDADAFREVGRLSTGYTDAELSDLTERLEALVLDRDGRDVTVRPELVLEVEYEELQTSPEYGSGYALRFPRFLGVREDLGPTDADTVERVEQLYEGQ
jgi:DNA ligase-1